MTKILKASSLIDTGLEQAQADELQSRFMAVDQSVASLCFLSIESKSLLSILGKSLSLDFCPVKMAHFECRDL